MTRKQTILKFCLPSVVALIAIVVGCRYDCLTPGQDVVDYIIQGNDGLTVFKEGTNTVSPQEESNNARVIIVDYFKEKTAKGETVSSKVEGRIRVVEG
jgi:hypothetical protein